MKAERWERQPPNGGAGDEDQAKISNRSSTKKLQVQEKCIEHFRTKAKRLTGSRPASKELLKQSHDPEPIRRPVNETPDSATDYRLSLM
jgi:hypothetical protein